MPNNVYQFGCQNECQYAASLCQNSTVPCLLQTPNCNSISIPRQMNTTCAPLGSTTGTSSVTTGNSNPQITTGNVPQVTTGASSPQVTTGASSPQVTTGAGSSLRKIDLKEYLQLLELRPVALRLPNIHLQVCLCEI